jgi:tetraacyldisaccharide-1-P 4'-kinase
MKVDPFDVVWHDGEKVCERPVAIIVEGKKLLVEKWIPVGTVRDFMGNEREVHKVVLEDGSSFRIEYFRSQDQCYVERLRSL